LGCDSNDNERNCVISIINAKRDGRCRVHRLLLKHMCEYYCCWCKIKGTKEDFLLSVDAGIYNKRYYYDMVIVRFGGGVQGGMEDKWRIRVCGAPLSLYLSIHPSLTFCPSHAMIPPTILDSLCIYSNITTLLKMYSSNYSNIMYSVIHSVVIVVWYSLKIQV